MSSECQEKQVVLNTKRIHEPVQVWKFGELGFSLWFNQYPAVYQGQVIPLTQSLSTIKKKMWDILNSWMLNMKVAQSCPTLCDPMDYTVHGILQARKLEWVAFPFSRGSSHPRNQTQVSRTAGRFFTSWATREAQ